MTRKRKAKRSSQPQPPPPKPIAWLKAVYHFHMFHYRMPETVAIAAMTPFVPSPLTIKMAMVAALLQKGEDQKAKQLVPYLPKIEVRIKPPSAAFSFKAFLRYRSVPAVPECPKCHRRPPPGDYSVGEMIQCPKCGKEFVVKALFDDGSFYPSRPHTREYALFATDLTVFVGLPDTAKELVKEALQNIRYLGCKDSQVWCRGVEEVSESELQTDRFVTRLEEGQAGAVVLLADFAPDAQLTLEDLIPGKRQKEHFQHPPPPYVLPGKVIVKGRTRLFLRQNRGKQYAVDVGVRKDPARGT